MGCVGGNNQRRKFVVSTKLHKVKLATVKYSKVDASSTSHSPKRKRNVMHNACNISIT